MDELNKVFENVAEYFQPALRANQIEDPALSLPRFEKPVNEVVEALGLTASQHLASPESSLSRWCGRSPQEWQPGLLSHRRSEILSI